MGALIRLSTESRVSHTGVITGITDTGDWQVTEAVGEGVVNRTVAPYDAIVIRLTDVPEITERIVQQARAIASFGYEYDWGSIGTFAIRILARWAWLATPIIAGLAGASGWETIVATALGYLVTPLISTAANHLPVPDAPGKMICSEVVTRIIREVFGLGTIDPGLEASRVAPGDVLAAILNGHQW